MKSDIEIAQSADMRPIKEIAARFGIGEEDLELYGKYKTKLSDEYLKSIESNENGKLILVTAINPTPAGEGKTTISIGLADALNRAGKKTMVALREPSLGPCFGVKGGAAGGGYAQVVPMEELNLHFTGDFHAITSANNLLAAMLDNHIQQGNALQIDTRQIVWKRCLDMNDRVLRNVVVGLGAKADGFVREDHFVITVATEIMAILCLANDMDDLKDRLGRIIVAYNYALVHGGPFANIAHGCNSVRATKTALKLADYVVTEAGFGADLGAEKFMDIKCRKAGIAPDAVVILATVKALKYNGGVKKDELAAPNLEAVKKGIVNLDKHIENLHAFGVPVVVTLNSFLTDTEEEYEFIKKHCEDMGCEFALARVWAEGGKGGEELAAKVIRTIENKKSELKFTYELDAPLKDKIEAIATKIYGAGSVTYSAEASRMLKKIEKMGYGNLPVCMAKNQYSLSDDPNALGRPEGFNVNIREVYVSAGAGFVVAITGTVMTMPGLPKVPAAENIDVVDDKIVGLF